MSVDNPVILRAGPPDNVSVVLRIQNDVIGSEEDESVTLELELVSPMDFSGLIDLRSRGSGVTNQLTIVIRDDDRKSDIRTRLYCMYDYCTCMLGIQMVK